MFVGVIMRDRRRYNPPSCGKKVSNLTVASKPNEHPERLIRRFLKKCKKMKILEIYRDKTEFHRKPSEIRRKKAIRRKRLIKKEMSQTVEGAKRIK
jgi:ribosomal protein S21